MHDHGAENTMGSANTMIKNHKESEPGFLGDKEALLAWLRGVAFLRVLQLMEKR